MVVAHGWLGRAAKVLQSRPGEPHRGDRPREGEALTCRSKLGNQNVGASTLCSRNALADARPALASPRKTFRASASGAHITTTRRLKALALIGKLTVLDRAGHAHDWRADLVLTLSKRQNANGSWIKRADSFVEGGPNILIAYGLLALAYARPARRSDTTLSR